MNKIITISGEPASGKSTVIKDLKRKYEEQGIKVTVLSLGQIIRAIAQKENLSIAEFNEQLKHRKDIDYRVDSMTKKYGEEFNNTRGEDEILIIDARLAWKTVPESFAIRLSAIDSVAAKRAFNDPKRGKEDKYASIEDALKATSERKKGEVERYKMRYGVDLEDENNYNLVIDTSFSDVGDISNTIMECFELEKQGKSYGRNWTSPKTLLPLQDVKETAYLFEEMKKAILKYGFFPEQTIDAIQVDGVKFIVDGNHRNFAVASLGGTLVPYQIIGKDDEPMSVYGTSTARERIFGFEPKKLYDYEPTFDKPGKTFSYKEIYPEIFDPKFVEKLKTGKNPDVSDDYDEIEM